MRLIFIIVFLFSALEANAVRRCVGCDSHPWMDSTAISTANAIAKRTNPFTNSLARDGVLADCELSEFLLVVESIVPDDAEDLNSFGVFAADLDEEYDEAQYATELVFTVDKFSECFLPNQDVSVSFEAARRLYSPFLNVTYNGHPIQRAIVHPSMAQYFTISLGSPVAHDGCALGYAGLECDYQVGLCNIDYFCWTGYCWNGACVCPPGIYTYDCSTWECTNTALQPVNGNVSDPALDWSYGCYQGTCNEGLGQCVCEDEHGQLTHYCGLTVDLVPQAERDALLDGYDSMGGDFWYSSVNWRTPITVCLWQWVLCDAALSNVIGFYPRDNNMTGNLPTSFVNLRMMTQLDAAHNHLGDFVPGELVPWFPHGFSTKFTDLSFNKWLCPLPTCIMPMEYICSETHPVCDWTCQAVEWELTDISPLSTLALQNIDVNITGTFHDGAKDIVLYPETSVVVFFYSETESNPAPPDDCSDCPPPMRRSQKSLSRARGVLALDDMTTMTAAPGIEGSHLLSLSAPGTDDHQYPLLLSEGSQPAEPPPGDAGGGGGGGPGPGPSATPSAAATAAATTTGEDSELETEFEVAIPMEIENIEAPGDNTVSFSLFSGVRVQYAEVFLYFDGVPLAHNSLVLDVRPCPSGSQFVLGTVEVGGANATEWTCMDCKPGYWGGGSDSCTPCPKGYYYPFEGAPTPNTCLKCPDNSDTQGEGKSSRGDCVCAEGYHGDLSDPVQFCVDYTCPDGQYYDVALCTSMDCSGCKSCEPGSYTNSETGMAERTGCTLCDEGQYTNRTGAKECDSCPLGTYASSMGSTECVSCPGNATTVTLGRSLDDCVCAVGYYRADNATGMECYECPTGATCDGGTALPIINEGYWADSKSGAEILVTSCTRERSCRGGSFDLPPDERCATGHTDRLCSDCHTGYWVLNGQCVRCPSTSFHVGYLLLIITVVLLWLPVIRRAAIALPGLYCVLPFFQILALIGEFRLPWPIYCSDLFGVLSLLNFNINLTLYECYSSYGFHTAWGFYILLPFIFLVYVLLSIAAVTAFNKTGRFLITYGVHNHPRFCDFLARHRAIRTRLTFKSDEDLVRYRNESISFYLFILNMSYVISVSKALQIFVCKDYSDDRDPFLVAAPYNDCDGRAYSNSKVFGGIGLTLYLLGVPGLFAYGLWWRGKGRRYVSEVHLERFGFLYRRFERPYYLWEGVTLLRKVLFAIIRTLMYYDAHMQASAALVVISINLVAQFYARPYEADRYDVLECVLLYITFLTILVGLLFELGEHRDVFYNPDRTFGIVPVILFVVALVTILAVIFLDFRELMMRTYADLVKKLDKDGDGHISLKELYVGIRESVKYGSPTARQRSQSKIDGIGLPPPAQRRGSIQRVMSLLRGSPAATKPPAVPPVDRSSDNIDCLDNVGGTDDCPSDTSHGHSQTVLQTISGDIACLEEFDLREALNRIDTEEESNAAERCSRIARGRSNCENASAEAEPGPTSAMVSDVEEVVPGLSPGDETFVETTV